MTKCHTADFHQGHSNEHETAKQHSIYASARFRSNSPRLLVKRQTRVSYVTHTVNVFILDIGFEYSVFR